MDYTPLVYYSPPQAKIFYKGFLSYLDLIMDYTPPCLWQIDNKGGYSCNKYSWYDPTSRIDTVDDDESDDEAMQRFPVRMPVFIDHRLTKFTVFDLLPPPPPGE